MQTLKDLVDGSLDRGLFKETKRVYERIINRVLRQLGLNPDLESKIAATQIHSTIKAHLINIKGNYAPGHYYAIASILNTFLDYIVDQNLITNNPIKGMVKPPRKKRQTGLLRHKHLSDYYKNIVDGQGYKDETPQIVRRQILLRRKYLPIDYRELIDR